MAVVNQLHPLSVGRVLQGGKGVAILPGHMPAYDYYCESNGLTVEASHPMSDTLSTWGELCDNQGLALGETPPSAPLQRVFSAPLVSMGTAEEVACDVDSGPCHPTGCACCN